MANLVLLTRENSLKRDTWTEAPPMEMITWKIPTNGLVMVWMHKGNTAFDFHFFLADTPLTSREAWLLPPRDNDFNNWPSGNCEWEPTVRLLQSSERLDSHSPDRQRAHQRLSLTINTLKKRVRRRQQYSHFRLVKDTHVSPIQYIRSWQKQSFTSCDMWEDNPKINYF